MCGPTGIGVLWGRRELLDELPPFLGGGEMIETVTMTGSTYAPLPHKFEAGTPPIAQAVGLGAAVDYLTGIGMDAVAAHEQEITAYALERLRRGARPDASSARTTPVDRGGAVSLHPRRGIHPHDVGQVLDSRGRRGARRPPLRPAGLRPVRRPGDHAGVVLPLHDAGRGRRAGRAGLDEVRRRFFGVKLDSLYQEIILDHYKHPHHAACASRSTPRCTTSTRPAATR